MYYFPTDGTTRLQAALPPRLMKVLTAGFATLMFGLATAAHSAEDSSRYRATESFTHSAQQQVMSRAQAAQPDPIPRLLAANTSTPATETNDRSIDWYYGEAWITQIDSYIYGDRDRDGYFSGLTLTIDADTRQVQNEVYVIIELQPGYGARERLHTTGNFMLYGSSFSDEYRIDIDLLRHYDAAQYDLYIELLDARTNRVLDSVGAQDFNNLRSLPLESEDLDSQYYPTQDPGRYVQNDDILAHEYAGSTGALLALLLAGELLRRRRNRQPQPARVVN